jgi:hypothetical protein
MVVVTPPRPTGASELPFTRAAAQASIELYWLPLGAGGWFVRLNGRIYEAIHALLERRRPLDLYHTALQVRLPEGRFVIENCWPIPDADGAARGVVVQGPSPAAGWRASACFARGAPVAGRDNCRRRRGGRKPPAPEPRPTPGASPPRPGRLSAQPGVGPRRAGDGRDVELQFGDFVAAGSERSPDGCDRSPGRRPRAGMAGGPGHGRRQQRSDERAGHDAGSASTRVGGQGWQRPSAPPQPIGSSVSARVVMSGEHHPRPIQPLLDVKRGAEELATRRNPLPRAP